MSKKLADFFFISSPACLSSPVAKKRTFSCPPSPPRGLQCAQGERRLLLFSPSCRQTESLAFQYPFVSRSQEEDPSLSLSRSHVREDPLSSFPGKRRRVIHLPPSLLLTTSSPSSSSPLSCSHSPPIGRASIPLPIARRGGGVEAARVSTKKTEPSH